VAAVGGEFLAAGEESLRSRRRHSGISTKCQKWAEHKLAEAPATDPCEQMTRWISADERRTLGPVRIGRRKPVDP
jgi:hypothetical protein